MLRPSFVRLLRTLVSLSSKEQPIPLGRWNVTHDEKTISKTVKWSNEDHCGVCAQEFKYEEQAPPSKTQTSTQTSKTQTSTQPSKTQTSTQSNNPTSQSTHQTKITMDNCCGNGCPNCPAYIEFFCTNPIN